MRFKNILTLFLAFMCMAPVLHAKKKPPPPILTCSPDAGTVVLNEVALTSSQFIEIKFLADMTVSGWQLCYKKKKGKAACTNFPSVGSYSSGDYAVYNIPKKKKLNQTEGEIYLLDGNGKILDAFFYCNRRLFCSIKQFIYAGCSTTLSNHNPSNKDMARIPDGTGNFQDNGSSTTPGCNNSGCGGGGGDTGAESFNCVEPGADPIIGHIYTKRTGQSFMLDIIALKKNGSVETKFAKGKDHTVTLELVDASGGGNCGSLATLTPAVAQNLVFTASDAGSKTSSPLSVNGPYRNIKCRTTDTTNPTKPVVGCSSDAFAIRPSDLTVTSNMTNTASSGVPKAKAGDPFTISAAALPGYDGTPSIDAGKVQDHNGILRNGAVTGFFNTANAATGIATGSNFSYAEVGQFRFLPQGVYDNTFTSIDQPADCTDNFNNTPDGSGRIGCKFGSLAASSYFGRFTPHHFDVWLNTPEFAPGCGTFTYIGQPVTYAIQPVASFSAKNAAGTVTENYTGSYWKIAANDLTYGITPAYSETSHGLSVLVASPPSATDSGDGTGQLVFADTSSAILAVARNTPENVFDAEIAMSFSLQDTDGIAVANVGGIAQGNPVSFGSTGSGNGIGFAGGNKQQRWGRLNIGSAHGSELLNLPVLLTAEYFDGTNFIVNTADNCTTLTLAGDLLLSNPETSGGASQIGTTNMTIGSGNSSALLANSPLLSGAAGLSFSAPGAGNTGYIDITGNFATLPWLLYDWNNDSSHDDNPKGKATFGLYKGNSSQIYFREVY